MYSNNILGVQQYNSTYRWRYRRLDKSVVMGLRIRRQRGWSISVRFRINLQRETARFQRKSLKNKITRKRDRCCIPVVVQVPIYRATILYNSFKYRILADIFRFFFFLTQIILCFWAGHNFFLSRISLCLRWPRKSIKSNSDWIFCIRLMFHKVFAVKVRYLSTKTYLLFTIH